MDNKEHIDRLYQEKFKDFEVTPPAKVWQNIEASLQKKKRRVLPFWWISGGAVATLLIGLLLFPFSSEKQLNEFNPEEVIITENKEIKSKKILKKLPVENHENQEKSITTVEVATTKPIQKTIEKQKKNNLIKKQEIPTFNKTKIAVVTKKKNIKNSFKNNGGSTENNSKKTKVSEKKKHKKVDIKTQLPISKKTQKLVAFDDENNEEKKEKLQKRWSVTPSIALLNSGSFSKSSPLGTSLDNNPTSGENSYSYGVKMGYKINEKWEIQSGIHLQEVQFSTQNVTFGDSALDSKLNINYFREEKFIYSSSIDTSGEFDGSGFIANNTTVNQSFGYVEIPIEVKYTLFKKSKISAQLVTGVSSLFLSKNKIGASSTKFSGIIGETNNLNTLNFSGNIGLDLHYQLFERLQLNVNPMFKQQFNTFSKSTNGFKPYSIGIYTGLRYQF